MKLLLMGGIGDCFLAPNFIDMESVTDCYWANEPRELLKPIFSKVYPQLKHHEVEYDRKKNFIMASQLQAGSFPSDCIQWTPEILSMTDHKTFRKNPFITTVFADINKFNLPDEYTVIQPYTFSSSGNRDFKPDDWKNCLEALGNRVGVVVDATSRFVPDDDRLINLQGKTSLVEAMEIVKGGSAFIGIDSCFSILFNQTGKPLQVRCMNTWVYGLNKIYFAPKLDDKHLSWGIQPKFPI